MEKSALRAALDDLTQQYYQSHERSFTPLFPWVFVFVLKGEQQRGSIILPGKQNRTVHEGIVLRTWEPFEKKVIQARNTDGTLAEKYVRVNCQSELTPGDHVMFPHWAGMDIEGFSREQFRVIREDVWSISRDGGVFAILDGENGDGLDRLRACVLASLTESDFTAEPVMDTANALLKQLREQFVIMPRSQPMSTLSGR